MVGAWVATVWLGLGGFAMRWIYANVDAGADCWRTGASRGRRCTADGFDIVSMYVVFIFVVAVPLQCREVPTHPAQKNKQRSDP